MKKHRHSGESRNLAMVTFLLWIPAFAGMTAMFLHAESKFPRTIDAGGGRKLTLERPPRRIVSLTISVDEILSSLVDKSRVQAVSHLAIEPTLSNVIPWAREIPRKISQDIEQIIACDPDIVFLLQNTRFEIVQALLQAHVPVVQIDIQNSIQDVKNDILKIGKALGEEDKAKKLIEEMDKKLFAIAEKIKTVKKRPRVMTYHFIGSTAGKERTANEMITLGGGINIPAEEGIVGSVKISEEKIIEWNPEALLLSGYSPHRETFPDEVRANPALQTVSAVKNNKVYVIPGKYFMTSSQYLVDGVEAVARVLHPELFSNE